MEVYKLMLKTLRRIVHDNAQENTLKRTFTLLRRIAQGNDRGIMLGMSNTGTGRQGVGGTLKWKSGYVTAYTPFFWNTLCGIRVKNV